MSSKTILIATREIHGGTEKGGRAVLEANAELTAEKKKELGLDKDGIGALVESGALIERQARLASGEDAAAAALLKTETARADKAESELASLKGDFDTAAAEITDLKKQVETLTAELEAAKKAAPKPAQ